MAAPLVIWQAKVSLKQQLVRLATHVVQKLLLASSSTGQCCYSVNVIHAASGYEPTGVGVPGTVMRGNLLLISTFGSSI